MLRDFSREWIDDKGVCYSGAGMKLETAALYRARRAYTISRDGRMECIKNRENFREIGKEFWIWWRYLSVEEMLTDSHWVIRGLGKRRLLGLDYDISCLLWSDFNL